MKQIPIKLAKHVAETLDADAVIIVAFNGNSYGTTSYGKDRATCQAFVKVCDQIHDDIRNGCIPIPDATE